MWDGNQLGEAERERERERERVKNKYYSSILKFLTFRTFDVWKAF